MVLHAFLDDESVIAINPMAGLLPQHFGFFGFVLLGGDDAGVLGFFQVNQLLAERGAVGLATHNG